MVQIKIDLYMSYYEKVDRHAIIQNDNEGVALVCSLKNPDGTIYEVPEGASVLFVAAKPDGKGVILSTDDEQVAYDGNIVTVTIPQSVTAVKGLVLCKLIIQETEKTASSQVFRLSCEGDLIPGDLIESVEYQSLVTMLNHLGAREAEFDDMKEQFYQAINGLTEDDEVINARIDGPYSTTYDTLKLRLDAMSALLKGIVDGDFENRVSDLEDEVEDARGEFDALVDRLDDTDGRIADNAGEIDSAKVKILQLEQENKQLKKIVEDSNPTQSPRVSSVGYGVVSLPKNAGQGPVDVRLEGLTLKNELDYNPATWEEWTLAANASISNGLVFAGAGSASTSRLYINAKSNTKYGLLFNVLENSINGAFRMHSSLTGATEVLFEGGLTGPFKKTFLTQGVIEDNYIGFNLSSPTTEGEVKISDIRLFELPPGSEIESDFESLSADELARKYPYVQGGEPRNTSGTFRVRSVGKNLFDASGPWYYGRYRNGIVEANTGLSNIATFPVTLTSANRSIFRVYFCKENTMYTVSISNFEATDINISLTQYASIESAASFTNALASTTAEPLKKVATLNTVSGGNILLVAISGNYDTLQTEDIIINDIGLVQLEYGTKATEYEPYTESEQYVNGPELRSLPNGTKDKIDTTQGKLIKRISDEYTLQDSDIVYINAAPAPTQVYIVLLRELSDYIGGRHGYVDANYILEGYPEMQASDTLYNNTQYIGCSYVREQQIRVIFPVGTTIEQAKQQLAGTTLTYQLAEPIEIPIQVSGSLHSYPSGTVYIEPAIADAGVYDGGFAILNTDFPIAELESVQKIDFQTGLSTELDVGQAVIAGDGLSFTHPGLTDGDIVFVTYLYDDSNYTAGKATCEYYDSRVVFKDTVTGKYYRKVETVENGELVTQLVEV